jgi:hypothetical protein
MSNAPQHYPKSMNAVDFDGILRDPQRLAGFLESTLGDYILLWDQTITGLTFDNMAIVLAKASTLGFRTVTISTVGGTNGMFMYALLEKEKK